MYSAAFTIFTVFTVLRFIYVSYLTTLPLLVTSDGFSVYISAHLYVLLHLLGMGSICNGDPAC